MNVNEPTLYPSTRIQAAGTVYSAWKDLSGFLELLAFLKVTAQGAYTDETLIVSVQIKSPEGDALDMNGAVYTTIGDVTLSLPYIDYLPLIVFGKEVRFKIVTAGSAVDYTLRILANVKKGE